MNLLTPYMLWIKIGFYGIMLLGCGYTGWKLHGWYNDSKNLAVLEQTAKIEQDFRTHEQNVATTLENKLKELKANERIINNEKIKIVDRPIYNNTCLDIDGVSLANQARGVKNTDSSKPTN